MSGALFVMVTDLVLRFLRARLLLRREGMARACADDLAVALRSARASPPALRCFSAMRGSSGAFVCTWRNVRHLYLRTGNQQCSQRSCGHSCRKVCAGVARLQGGAWVCSSMCRSGVRRTTRCGQSRSRNGALARTSWHDCRCRAWPRRPFARSGCCCCCCCCTCWARTRRHVPSRDSSTTPHVGCFGSQVAPCQSEAARIFCDRGWRCSPTQSRRKWQSFRSVRVKRSRSAGVFAGCWGVSAKMAMPPWRIRPPTDHNMRALPKRGAVRAVAG